VAAGSATMAGLAPSPEAQPDGPHHIPALGVRAQARSERADSGSNGRPIDVGRAEITQAGRPDPPRP